MDRIQIAAYTRSWCEVLSGPPAQNQRRRSAGSERKEETSHRSISVFSEKTCPNNGGKLRAQRPAAPSGPLMLWEDVDANVYR